jgi:hypothetical protein
MNATLTNEERELQENQQQADAQLAGFAELGKMSLIPYEERGNDADELIEQAQEDEANGVLSIEIKRTAHIVLCTGGPHCEIRWPEDGTPSIVCYGWFGAGRYERELTTEEVTGLEYALGDWETLAGIES